MKLHFKGVLFFIILLITFIGLNAFVQGQSGSVTFTNWTATNGFDGFFINTTPNGGNISLNFTDPVNMTYFGIGTYISFNGTEDVNIGKIVNWTNITWSETVNVSAGQNILLQAYFKNNQSGNWSVPTQWFDDGVGTLGNVSRFIRYDARLETGDNTTTPYLEDVTISYTEIAPSLFSQSPGDGSTITNGSININCSASEDNLPGVVGLENMTLYWNYSGTWEANETQQMSGGLNTTVFSKTNLQDGTYIWNCLVYNNNTDFDWGVNRTFTATLGASDTDAPVITSTEISPAIVLIGGNVSLNISATDSLGLIDSLWASITTPNSTVDNVTLVNNQAVDYTPGFIGTYSVVFHANDTAGNEANTTGSFEANEMKTFNASVVGSSGGGIDSNLTVFVTGGTTAQLNLSSTAGNFTNLQLIGGVYDFLFKAFSGDIQVTLEGVNISENLNRTFGMDKLTTSVTGFGETYAVNSSYIINSAAVKIFYTQSNFLDENFISVQKCDNWSFSGRNCLGNWTDITASHDKTDNFFEFSVSSFSGFGIKQNTFCGDGTCDTGETNTSCPGDCQCSANETQSCGSSDVGHCAYGVQSCTNGGWGTCIGAVDPINETCNLEDDNCDGIVDNVNDGNSINSTACQCYNGTSPLATESCNAIDDNCNGQIDESVSRQCGPNQAQVDAPNSTCTFGTSVCSNGQWGQCQNAVLAGTNDICGASGFGDGLNNDCDNETDEFCASCSNGIQDGDEEGVDCGGSCNGDCFVFPLDLFIILAVIIGVSVIALFAAFRILKGRKVTWEGLEEKYGRTY